MDTKELWDHCLFCPVCQNAERKMFVSVGPDAVFSLNRFQKRDSLLYLQCIYRKESYLYTVEYNIDCNTNLFDVAVPQVQINIPGQQIAAQRVSRAYFYFYLQSRCEQCDGSAAYSNDLELDVLDKKVFNIELERERFVITDDTVNYYLTVIHDQDLTLVSNDSDQGSIKLPLLNIDFSDQPKMINKIKTLILFS